VGLTMGRKGDGSPILELVILVETMGKQWLTSKFRMGDSHATGPTGTRLPGNKAARNGLRLGERVMSSRDISQKALQEC
jgi:hypothetical protein